MDTRFANGWDEAQARAAMMLDPTVTNLNTGSFGPLPHVVFERVTELRRRLAEEPMDFLVARVPGRLWEARHAWPRFCRRSAPVDLHGQRDGVDQHRRLGAEAGRAGRNPADRSRIRRHALVLGAGRPAVGLTLRTFPLPTCSRSARDRRGRLPGDDGANTLVLLQPCAVADGPGAAGAGTVRGGARARHPHGRRWRRMPRR